MAITIKDLSSISNIEEILNGLTENWPKLKEGSLMVWLMFGFSAYCLNSFKFHVTRK